MAPCHPLDRRDAPNQYQRVTAARVPKYSYRGAPYRITSNSVYSTACDLVPLCRQRLSRRAGNPVGRGYRGCLRGQVVPACRELRPPSPPWRTTRPPPGTYSDSASEAANIPAVAYTSTTGRIDPCCGAEDPVRSREHSRMQIDPCCGAEENKDGPEQPGSGHPILSCMFPV